MNILFIGPYRQADTWGSISQSLIRSISMIEDVGLTTRPIFLSNSIDRNVDPNIFQFEANKEEKYDILIQHTLPSYMIYNGEFDKVVGFTSFETKGNEQWDNYLRLLDKLLVSTEAEKEGVSKDIREKTFSIGAAQEVDSLKNNIPTNRFAFYCFGGGLESRTSVKEVIQAYFSEFHLNDNVSLVLQVNDQQKAQALVDQVAQEVGFYSLPYYPHIHLVEKEDSLHDNGNCFIDVSSSIGFNPETAKALLKGNTPIVLKGSGRDEYVKEESGFIVDSIEDLLICPDRPLKDMFTARETCFKPRLSALKDSMREAFDSKISQLRKSKSGIDSKEMLSYKKQSKLIKEILCS
tara:strand:- start:2296 stop:3345 length:1050 start_codon:yes stop_codon:yes gene_type:complete